MLAVEFQTPHWAVSGASSLDPRPLWEALGQTTGAAAVVFKGRPAPAPPCDISSALPLGSRTTGLKQQLDQQMCSLALFPAFFFNSENILNHHSLAEGYGTQGCTNITVITNLDGHLENS